MALRRSKTPASAVALGGLLAAVAVIIMCLGGLIPVATFTCPAMCMIVLRIVMTLCGKRMAWAWYGAVAILCALMAPDKEAAAIFVCLGYYPILKPWFDRKKLGFLYKAVYFNAVILAMYTALIYVLGLQQIMEEFSDVGTVVTVVMLLLGNVVFFLLDVALGRRLVKKHG